MRLALSTSLSSFTKSVVPFVGPLDAYAVGLGGAYSVARRLLSSYGGALIRVRRSSDNTEVDIGFTSDGLLDVAVLLAFTGGGSAYVVIIYDQSGLGRNLLQSTAVAQRRVVNAGSLETVGTTAGMFSTAENTQGYRTTAFTTYTGAVLSVFTRSLASAAGFINSRVLSLITDGTPDYTNPSVCAVEAGGTAPTGILYAESNGNTGAGISITLGVQLVASSIFDGSNNTISDGVNTGVGAFTSSFSVNRILAAGPISESSYNVSSGDGWAECAIYFADKLTAASVIRAALTP